MVAKTEHCTKYDPHSAKRKLERGKVNAGMKRAIVLADKDYNDVKGTENAELVRKIREIASNPTEREDAISEMQWDYFVSWQGAVRGIEIGDLHEDDEDEHRHRRHLGAYIWRTSSVGISPPACASNHDHAQAT